MTNLPAVYVPEQLRNVFLSESVTHSYADIGIVESVFIKITEAELSVESHKNAVDVHTNTYSPSCIETAHTRTVFIEDTELFSIRNLVSCYHSIYFHSCFAAHTTCKVRTCSKEQVDIVGNIKTQLHIDRYFKIKLVGSYFATHISQSVKSEFIDFVHGTFLREEQRRLQSNKVVERIFHTQTYAYSRLELGSVRAVTDI